MAAEKTPVPDMRLVPPEDVETEDEDDQNDDFGVPPHISGTGSSFCDPTDPPPSYHSGDGKVASLKVHDPAQDNEGSRASPDDEEIFESSSSKRSRLQYGGRRKTLSQPPPGKSPQPPCHPPAEVLQKDDDCGYQDTDIPPANPSSGGSGADADSKEETTELEEDTGDTAKITMSKLQHPMREKEPEPQNEQRENNHGRTLSGPPPSTQRNPTESVPNRTPASDRDAGQQHSNAEASPSPSKSPNRNQADAASDTDHHVEGDADQNDEGIRTPSSPIPQKRKRGRPRKSIAQDPIESVQMPQKRKRGRPRKSITQNPIDSVQAAEDEESGTEQPPLKKQDRHAEDEKQSSSEESQDMITTAPPSIEKKAPKTPWASSSGKQLRVLLSASNLTPYDKGWMTKRNIKFITETPSKPSNFFCVVRDASLPSTVKVLKTLMAGRPVVSDSWITMSKQKKNLLDPDEHLHHGLVGTARTDRQSLFAGKRAVFTTAAAKTWQNDWQEIPGLLSDAGAISVASLTFEGAEKIKPYEEVLLFGVDNAVDKDATHLLEAGRTVYDRAMVAQSIIHAELDLENTEFQLRLPLGGSKSNGKK